jgi:hypothetical protein
MSFLESKVKGSIAVGRGDGVGILPVGADGEVLTADSAQPLGVKFAPAGTSGLVLVERHVAGADETSHTFSGLDGNTDEVYFLSWHIIKATTANNEIDLQPNGSGVNLSWAGAHSINGAGMTGMGTLTRWFLNQNNSGAASEPMCGEATFFCKTIGTTRRLIRILGTDLEGPTGLFIRDMAGSWDDLVTNITSLVVISSVVNGIKAGSVITLYKRPNG